MANSGPDTNESRFLIVTAPAPHLNGKHVVFGKLIKGFGVLHVIERVAVAKGYYPTVDVVIVDCGEIPQGADDGTINFFKDGDMYPDWPLDLDAKPDGFSWIISAVESIKTTGNEYFKKQDFKMALRKYNKALKFHEMCWNMPEIDQEKSNIASKTKSQILTNSSICKLKLGDLRRALFDAKSAISETPYNAKAFYRQGQVYIALNKIDEAAESFQKALELEPNDCGIKKELANMKKKATNDLDSS